MESSVGAWIAAITGLCVAVVSAVWGTKQARIAAQPSAQSALNDGYAGLLDDMRAELARLHDEIAASRAAEARCVEEMRAAQADMRAAQLELSALRLRVALLEKNKETP